MSAEKIVGDDFNVAEGIVFKQWPTPCAKNIGPWARKSVRCCFHLYFLFVRC